jgi:predicted  nucleic acid-binding Zn-ribbon protein
MEKALSPTVDKICGECFNGLPEKEENRVKKDTKLKTCTNIMLYERRKIVSCNFELWFGEQCFSI